VVDLAGVAAAEAGAAMKLASNAPWSPRRKQAADVLRRARKLAVGPARNDLRQLAMGLLWLERRGLSASRKMAKIHQSDEEAAGLDRPNWARFRLKVHPGFSHLG
jgi:hypothetical protein